MKRVCGFADSTRHTRQVCARRFLRWRFGRGSFDWIEYALKTYRDLSSCGPVIWAHPESAVWLFACVVFFGFRTRGLLSPGLAELCHNQCSASAAAATTLDPAQERKFLNSFSRATPKGRRDYAIALCLCALALRSEEVASLNLDDLDWRAMTLCLRQTKQRRQRLLPLPDSVARAILNYLKQGRPPTQSRALFVGHLPPYEGPMTASYVRVIVRNAFARCGMKPMGTHILRHSWATSAHRHGSGLKLIADVLGHRSLQSTQRYAHVNLEELRRVALPWPKTKR